MKRNARREMLAALEAELAASKLPTQQELKVLMRALAKGKAPRGAGFHDGLFAVIAQRIYTSAAKLKFKNEADLDRWLEQVKGLRYKLRPALAKATETLKDVLPRRGGPGRKRKLQPREARSACALVGTCIVNGMTVKDSIEQVAKDRNVSVRTMWRMWENRGA